MAFVPDDLLSAKRRDKLTPAAWDVYLAHCGYRNHQSGYSWATKERISREHVIPLGTVRNATTELRQKAWINETERGVRLLVGDFSPVDKKHRPAPEQGGGSIPGSGNSPAGEWHLVPDSGSGIPQIGNGIPESGKEIPGSGNSPYKDRARGSTSHLTSTLTSHSTNTHTPATGATAGEGAAADAGVCVPMPRSRFSREQVKAWAEQQKAEGGRIDPYAVARARWLDGTADEDVELFLAKREQIREGRPPEEQQLIPYHVALQIVASVAQAPGADVGAFVAGLENVSEETRERLRLRFLQAPAEAAAGRAPP